MKLDFNKEVIGIDGKAVNSEERYVVLKEDGSFLKNEQGIAYLTRVTEPLRFKTLVINALMVKDAGADPTERINRFELTRLIQKAEEPIEIDPNTITRILNCAAKLEGTFEYGVINEFLKGE